MTDENTTEDFHKTSFQFISEPSDVNFGGKVHGGVVMKWIDQTAYTCARTWAESYCVTVYVGGIRFYKPINIGEVIKIDATVIYTGKTSIHIMVEIYSRGFEEKDFEKKTHCIIIFVSVDENGSPKPVKPWNPNTPQEIKLAEYATRLKTLRETIHNEMKPFFNE
ncbi:acyl-CoA thioesterase [Algoriphagus sediminis]|uniref:Acyl-CoA thioesterase n=1 Tax=Algoriphagus sediminis TaxID=3057113 RepID=A0ABT7YEL8_9BACT|nr:acyl-CoA thioesterase [Algoriphagus sediminis]MDN3204963.1 acyl-CoA thioesterase [Algoriphagus sediminis]